MKKLFIVLTLLAVSALGGTYTYPIRIPTGGYGYDSCIVWAFNNTDSTTVTPLTVGTFPYAGAFTLNDTVSYLVLYKWIIDGDTAYSNEWVGPRLLGAPAISGTVTVGDTTNLSKLATDAAAKTWATAIASKTVKVQSMDDTVRQRIADAAADSAWSPTVTSIANRTVTPDGGTIDNVTNAVSVDTLVKAVQVGKWGTSTVTANDWAIKTGTPNVGAAASVTAAVTLAQADTAGLAANTASRVWAASMATKTVTTDAYGTGDTPFKLSDSAALVDKIWTTALGSKTVTTADVSANAIDSLALDTTAKKLIALRSDSGNVATIDSAALAGVTLVATVPDSLFDTLTAIHANTKASLDTLQNQDNWVAKEASVTLARDTANAILDSMQNDSSTLRFSGTATFDSVLMYRLNARAIYDSLAKIETAIIVGDTVGGGGDFLSTFADYRDAIRRRLGVSLSSTAWYPDSILNSFVKEAIAVVNPIMTGRVDTSIVELRYQKDIYSLDTSVMRVFSVRWKKADSSKSLLPVPTAAWYQQQHQTTDGQDGYLERPSYYDYVNGLLMVYPVPTVDYDTCYIVASKKITNLSSSTAIALIPQQYRSALLEYLCWKVGEAKQHPMAPIFKQNFFDILAKVQAMTQGASK